jgi:thiamine-monophosphate kinase
MTGEEALLAAVRDAFGRTAGAGVLVGIGDDAAVLEAPAGARLVATVDMAVEGQHFLLEGPGAAEPADVGWRALAASLSDVAAMGARPLWALCSLGLPPRWGPDEVAALASGMAELARAHGVAVVGGNLARVRERLVVDVAAVGATSRPFLRTGARAGDLLVVTGRLGAAAAGLRLLARPDLGARWPDLLRANRRPEPRLREGVALAERAPEAVHAACDVSDGLVRDAARLVPPDLGLELWAHALPIPDAVRAAAEALGAEALDWALYGGEDYELLLAVDPSSLPAVEAACRGGAGAHVVGAVVPRPGVALVPSPGAPARALEVRGWDPFRDAPPGHGHP